MKLIWRNIWRNRRRTVITMSSVFFAVVFCVFYSSYERGVWQNHIDNMLSTQTGHIQVHGAAYWDDKVVDNFMSMEWETVLALEQLSNIHNVSPRVETFAMASLETASKGVTVIGVSPEREAQKSNLPSRLVQGKYLTENDNGILIGQGLSNFLKADVGDTLALIGQGYRGSSAAQLFVVRGILQLMTLEMDNSMAYITLPAAQQFIDMPDGYSGVLIAVSDNRQLSETMDAVRLQLTPPPHDPAAEYAVLPWHFTMARLLQTSESNRVFLVLLMGILYIIVGFGILGTVVMMTNERIREFCVMVSLGMSRARLSVIVATELIIKTLIAATAAIAFMLPVTLWFSANPIPLPKQLATTMEQFGMEPFLFIAVDVHIFINQLITILAISLVAMTYPVQKILTLNLSKNK